MAGDDLRGRFLQFAGRAGDSTRFERGLQLLLDGIELDLERRSGG